jgi:hypothetical protein
VTTRRRKISSGTVMALIILGATVSMSQVPTISKKATDQKEVGLAVGQKAPPFKARDQRGQEQTPTSLAGPKGLILLFVRSADW